MHGNRHYEAETFADCPSITGEPLVTEEAKPQTDSLIELTADVVSAYVSNNPVPVADLPGLIGQVNSALKAAAGGAAEPAPEPSKPAVSIRKSVTDDFIVCLEDGKKFKSLKRHLATHYNLTPDEYRAKWGLDANYPMVAPAYAAARSALAKTMGLGRKPKQPEPPAPAPAKRSRKKATA
jgi:predicted transcriptional regulator